MNNSEVSPKYLRSVSESRLTMSLVLETGTPIDSLIQSSLENEDKALRLQWIPCSDITDIEPTQIDNVYYAISQRLLMTADARITLVLLGSNEECIPSFVNEFARIYSLPTHEHSNNVSHFRRYSRWLSKRNREIFGFTKYNNNYYMVAHKYFYHNYSRYGFCSECGLLRCSPVWCICGHKQLFDGWTSGNKQIDELIKKTQSQTNSANDAYLEWIPFDSIHLSSDAPLYGLPTDFYVEFTPLDIEITDKMHDLYYVGSCDDILATDVWVTIGFTYDTMSRQYNLIKERCGYGLCLACTRSLMSTTNAFCFECKAPRPLNWTTGNKTLDSFIMESWSNTENQRDAYIQWIEYSTLMNVREMTSLSHGCTRITDWLDPAINKLIKVTLRQISDAQSHNFHQLTLEYPKILTPDNVWVVGITQEPSTRRYYLVFYYDTRTILDKIIQLYRWINMEYSDFYDLKEIGSGGYRTVYTAKYKRYFEPETVVLKQYNDKNFDRSLELFVSELRNHTIFSYMISYSFLKIYGVTQVPETKDYIIVMQYANGDSLLSYLDQNINKLSWLDKLQLLKDIANHLGDIHYSGLVHCNLHGGNIIVNGNAGRTESLICDLGHSRTVKSHKSSPTIQGALQFIAPEVFHTRKFTQKSDVYSFGIIMHLIATGEQPFRDRQFDKDLICDIMSGLRPSMPDSAPEDYKKLAELCCDVDPDKRPDARTLCNYINSLIHSALPAAAIPPFWRPAAVPWRISDGRG